MNCEHVRLGSAEISDSGLCGFCWKERAEKSESALSVIPSTFYAELDSAKRLKLLVEDWRNTVVINQKLQDKLDRYEIEHPTICYQCGKPDKARVLVEALQKCLAHSSSNHELTLEYIRKALAELEKKTP